MKLFSFQNKNLVQPVKFFRTDGSLIQVFQQQWFDNDCDMAVQDPATKTTPSQQSAISQSNLKTIVYEHREKIILHIMM